MNTTGGARLVAAALLAMLATSGHAQSITLSPAVVQLRGEPGQGIEQVLTLRNDSGVPLSFVMQARDIVVRDGRRAEVEAGQLASGVAASAVFSAPQVTVPPMSQTTVTVTLTLPPQPANRAVNVYFRGTEPVAAGRTQALLSLGTLFTFALGDEVALDAEELRVTPPGTSRDLAASLRLSNTGHEPLVPTGMLAILDSDGRLTGKLPLRIDRLLPGETTVVEAQYGGELRAGHYQVVATLDVAGHALTRQSGVLVQ